MDKNNIDKAHLVKTTLETPVRVWKGREDWINTQDIILNTIPKTCKKLVIVAGHYAVAEHMSELSCDCETEKESFRFGMALTRNFCKLGILAKPVLWINDIGVEQERRSELHRNRSLPDSYLEILDQEGVRASDVEIYYESSVRNRASTLVRKMKKRKPHLFKRVPANRQGLLRCVENKVCEATSDVQSYAYIISGPNGEELVVKEGSSPKCNFILATFFDYLVRASRPDKIFNLFNMVYLHRIKLGIHVARTILANQVSFENIFFDGIDLIHVQKNMEVDSSIHAGVYANAVLK